MSSIHILWVDDEISHLKPHIIFLEQKNYKITPCTNGSDALEVFAENNFDIIFLDENMPGLSGLDTLSELKKLNANIPVVMITKSEEEYIMEEAIGSKIADYLIKPVNPNQILLSLKKNLDHSRLVSEKTSSSYLQEFREISLEMMGLKTTEDWKDLYQKLTFWELKLEDSQDPTLTEILEAQKTEANQQFGKFIENNYASWFEGDEGPTLSHNLFKSKIVPHLSTSQPTLLVVVDNLRYDQWKAIESNVNKHYKTTENSMYYSILPTATQYARNALFSGLMPKQMETLYPNYWKNDTDEGGKNLYEDKFLAEQLKRLNLNHLTHEYVKITNLKAGKRLADNFKSKAKNDLTVLVYNFVDMLSHSKTEMEVVKELASDDKGYRSLTQSWFKNSPLIDIIKQAQELNFKLIVTTDHGTINVKTPSKVIGDRETSLNLRYKTGRSLSYENRDVLSVKDPKSIGLPSISMNSSFIFAKENSFFAYPNNYNHYVSYYRNSYQHGGISLEEILIPFAVLTPR
ncbi:chemotaxis protein CheY [Formosa sp. Hel3_A1_48]|jgi:DNA-binding response OmpR family regulator|uniref:T9SS response regulator signal transducer PorX n=1 Tax=Formosa sp. Hel3_A1_48 TaxID=1336795 RepID=UPI00084E171B|nr:PglZ domain-containing protein [Formosa sp. Hel3_A1_48]AOR25208.1 chemotaxis protein CheY [Formosa sp. Hel3_A1_48]